MTFTLNDLIKGYKMRNFKKTPIDLSYLTSLSLHNLPNVNDNNNIIIKDLNDDKIVSTNIKTLSKDDDEMITRLVIEPRNYFISINPMRDLTYNRLKELLHLAYSRYLSFELGKHYRQKEPPIKMDIIIEGKDNKISYNHIHIITKTQLFIYDYIIFQSILYYYLSQSIANINVLGESIYTNELDTFNYINKTAVVDWYDENGHKQQKVIAKDQILMNETYI